MFEALVGVGVSSQGVDAAQREEYLAAYFSMFDSLMDVSVSSQASSTNIKW